MIALVFFGVLVVVFLNRVLTANRLSSGFLSCSGRVWEGVVMSEVVLLICFSKTLRNKNLT